MRYVVNSPKGGDDVKAFLKGRSIFKYCAFVCVCNGYFSFSVFRGDAMKTIKTMLFGIVLFFGAQSFVMAASDEIVSNTHLRCFICCQQFDVGSSVWKHLCCGSLFHSDCCQRAMSLQVVLGLETFCSACKESTVIVPAVIIGAVQRASAARWHVPLLQDLPPRWVALRVVFPRRNRVSVLSEIEGKYADADAADVAVNVVSAGGFGSSAIAYGEMPPFGGASCLGCGNDSDSVFSDDGWFVGDLPSGSLPSPVDFVSVDREEIPFGADPRETCNIM